MPKQGKTPRGDAQLKLLFSYLSEMQIGPYLWIRHWLEYEYGKEYFDALLKEVISVHAESRTNEEYFCSELNKEEIAEVVYHEGKCSASLVKAAIGSRPKLNQCRTDVHQKEKVHQHR